jgi:hypothetical protein
VNLSTTIGTAEKPGPEESLKIFPNPNNGMFKVVIPEGKNYNSLQIVNSMGMLIYHRDLSGISGLIEVMPENRWSPGIYFLRMNGKESSLNGVLVVE